MPDLRRGLILAAFVACAALFGAASARERPRASSPPVEVVVELTAPPLAREAVRSLAAARPHGRLALRSPAAVSYLRTLARAQKAVETRILAAVPEAAVRWRYSVVLNALAVVVPGDAVSRLDAVPGVARVYPSVTYHALLDQSPQAIGAPALWGPKLETAGRGIKIGVIDDGVDNRHAFFTPAGYSAPPGFPKGNRAYTNAKVIAARAFAPPSTSWRYARRPFDPLWSEHGTHVAGIAAGNNATGASLGRRVSGIAPKAYIGNYKVLTVPTTAFGLNGNSPEIAAGIEAAVRDGMDVINLSLGEAEIEPSRDLVVRAIDGAADAGVVPAVAAGNDFEDFGRGSLSSPGSAPKAITAAAATTDGQIAGFSSSGPTPVSLKLKPDVTAPGINILSSVPHRYGVWERFSGTSMASPHVAGAAALLRQRHPTWSVAQIKSALVLTGKPVSGASGREVATTREGGGMINLPEADKPLVFAAPTSLTFGLIPRGAAPVSLAIDLSDAGGGAGDWTVSLARQSAPGGTQISVPATVTVPGRLVVSAQAGPDATEEEVPGFIVLTNGTAKRRIPFWFRVTAPRLERHRRSLLRRAGTYRGNTGGQPAVVTSYRYPDDLSALGGYNRLPGPEQVFRFRLARTVANFGAAVIRQGRKSEIEPRLVFAGDENHLVGYAGLPFAINPYLDTFENFEPAVAAVRPGPGLYDIVFDTPSRQKGGRFTFRFWIDDRAAPRVRLLTRTLKRPAPLRIAILDRGSGVDPYALIIRIDGGRVTPRWSARTGQATIRLGQATPGRHHLFVQASDFQEAKNMENVPRILPNTGRLKTTFTVR